MESQGKVSEKSGNFDMDNRWRPWPRNCLVWITCHARYDLDYSVDPVVSYGQSLQ